MKLEEALSVLSQATEPNVKLTRGDYVLINQALSVLAEFIKQNTPKDEKVVDSVQ